MYTELPSNSQRFICLCLSSASTEGACMHARTQSLHITRSWALTTTGCLLPNPPESVPVTETARVKHAKAQALAPQGSTKETSAGVLPGLGVNVCGKDLRRNDFFFRLSIHQHLNR